MGNDGELGLQSGAGTRDALALNLAFPRTSGAGPQSFALASRTAYMSFFLANLAVFCACDDRASWASQATIGTAEQNTQRFG